MKVYNNTLRFIGVVQLFLGITFLFFSKQYANMMDLPQLPTWSVWLFTMMAARFLGYGVGMLYAAQNPEKHQLWIDTMIGIQAIDWISTIYFLGVGSLTLNEVTTAAFFPIFFILVLSYYRYIGNNNMN